MIAWAIPLLVVVVALVLAWPLGIYLRWAMAPESPGPLRQRYEALCCRLLGQAAAQPQDWKRYCLSLLCFNCLMFLVAHVVLTVQGYLPLNPDNRDGLEPSLAFNTAASFTTNTNLQHYSGEVSLSYFAQLFVIAWLQFVSAATGLAALTALARLLAQHTQMGNYYTDVWRATGLVLLPLAVVLAVLLVLCGVPMTLDGAAAAHTLEGVVQTIARGPVAAIVAIKQLGTNGGGFFGTNTAHPFENPSFWSNILNCVAILVLPMASVWMFGRIIQNLRHAAVIFAVMLLLYLCMLGSAIALEMQPTGALHDLPITASGNLEGKELRFGTTAGATWAVTTTVTSNGSVNCMHDSLNPLTGLLPMIGMWLNMVFGGIGVGMINMFLYIIIAVFLAGMMVGRTPEYLARKVEIKEMQFALLALLSHPVFILVGVAVFAVTPWGLDTIQDQGSHGLSEILYEMTSAAANNGSGFEGLGDNTIPWNVSTGVIMLLARFIPIIAPLAIAGLLARKRTTPESSGTFRTDTVLFGVILLATILIVGALLFLPVAVLGPIADHLRAA